MELIALLVFAIVTFSILVYYFVNTKDIFHPVVFTFLLGIITNLPFLAIIMLDKREMDLKVYNHVFSSNLSHKIGMFTFTFLLGFIGFVVGYELSRRVKIKESLTFVLNGKKFIVVSFITVAITLIAYIEFLNRIGGLTILLGNLERRAEFTNGNGILILITNMLMFLFLALFYQKNYYKNKLFLVITIITILLYFGINLSLAGRKSVLYAILMILIVINFSVNKIKVINYRTLIIICFAAIYIIAIPIIRQPKFLENMTENPVILIQEIKDKSFKQLGDISYVNTYIFIYDYFGSHDKWGLNVFYNLPLSFIPSNMYKYKPPVDEGVYVKSLLENYNVKPNDSFKSLYPSSLPPETFGNGYMSFGSLGVFAFFMLLGFIKGRIYWIMQYKKSFFSIFIYGYVLLNLQISNLRIVQTTSIIFLLIIWYICVTKNEGRVNKND